MRATVVEQWCEPRDMKLVELPDPVPAAGQVVIDARAIGCNCFDILIAQGKYQARPPLPFSPGAEVAGVVRAVGAGVSSVKPGDRVFAMLAWRGYASAVVAPAAAVVCMPASMSFEHGLAGAAPRRAASGEQATPHQPGRRAVSSRRVRDQHGEVPQQVLRPPAGHERPDDVDAVGERQRRR